MDVSKLRLKLVVHDVAQLYTSLPHDVVREALAWLTSTYKKTVRQKQAFIAVPIRGRQAKSQIHGGRSQNEATATTWSLESITALVDLSLEFSYLQLGVDHPLRQTVGIAMGCPASGALALTALAFMEHSSYQKIPAAMRPRLFGMRIMDDLARAVVYLVDDAQTEAEADRLLQATKYHDNLILEHTSDPAHDRETMSEDHGDPFLRRFRGCELKFSWSVDGTPSPHGRLRGACRVRLWRRFAAGQPVASQGGCQSADACERRA